MNPEQLEQATALAVRANTLASDIQALRRDGRRFLEDLRDARPNGQRGDSRTKVLQLRYDRRAIEQAISVVETAGDHASETVGTMRKAVGDPTCRYLVQRDNGYETLVRLQTERDAMDDVIRELKVSVELEEGTTLS